MTEIPLSREVRSIEVGKRTVSELVAEMDSTGYQGRRLGKAVEVWEAMLREPDLTIVLGYSGSMWGPRDSGGW